MQLHLKYIKKNKVLIIKVQIKGFLIKNYS